jgi:hypothetical protein
MNESETEKSETRNSAVLRDFVAYCVRHPHERFWQALRNWSGYNFILVSGKYCGEGRDTFSWEGKDE